MSGAGPTALAGGGSSASTSFNSATTASSSSSSSTTSPSPSSLTGPQVWLLKLPTFVAEQFKRVQQGQSQAQSSSNSTTPPTPITLGSLEVSYNKLGQQQLLFRYTPSDPTQPKEFLVKPRAKRSMLVFTEKTTTAAAGGSSSSSSISPMSSSSSSQSSSVSAVPSSCKFLAPVSLIADVVPPDTPLYRQFVTKRTASHQSSSATQRWDQSDEIVLTPQVVAEMERKRRREEEKKDIKEGKEEEGGGGGARGKKKEGKRVRGERAEVEMLLLRLFSETRWLTLKQLVEGTQQPINFLKEVMNAMCVRETRGENKDKYQLNDKYRIEE